MTTCKECLHLAVCGRYTATGGNVRECKHFVTDNNVGGKWIPVSERLPETFGEYIVAVKALDGTFYSDYADYDPFEQRWNTGLYRCPTEEVTHWMPLPEPPKGE